jgi:hypothetical protein
MGPACANIEGAESASARVKRNFIVGEAVLDIVKSTIIIW